MKPEEKTIKELIEKGAATLNYQDTVVKGRGIYFSFDREFIKIFSQSEIRAKGLKTDARSLL